MSSPATPTSFNAIKTSIRLRHLQQLQNLDLSTDITNAFPVFATYDDIIQWTKDSMAQIDIAKDNCKFQLNVLDHATLIIKFQEFMVE